jgi:hypothetical protein
MMGCECREIHDLTPLKPKYKTPTERSKHEANAQYSALIKPKSIICVLKGFDYFNGDHTFPSKTSKEFFYTLRTQAQRVLAIYKLDLDVPLPISPVEKNKLWNSFIRPYVPLVRESHKYCKSLLEAGVSSTGSADDLERWIEQLTAEVSLAKKAALKAARERRSKSRMLHAQRLGICESADPDLTVRLADAAREAIADSLSETSGFLYFKAWIMPDGHRWYKIGITSDLQRRGAEQNVLPVPPVTLYKLQFRHIYHARAAEQAFHTELTRMRIRGAKNRELFSLSPQQVASVIEAMKAVARGL